MLLKHDIENNLLVPSSNVNMRVQIDPYSTESPFPCFLPLEIFDNTEYDCRTPSDWLKLGVEGKKRKPVPGKALLPSGNNYLFCIIY